MEGYFVTPDESPSPPPPPQQQQQHASGTAAGETTQGGSAATAAASSVTANNAPDAPPTSSNSSNNNMLSPTTASSTTTATVNSDMDGSNNNNNNNNNNNSNTPSSLSLLTITSKKAWSLEEANEEIALLLEGGKVSMLDVSSLQGLLRDYSALQDKVTKLKSLLGRSAKAQREAKVEVEMTQKRLDQALRDVERLQTKVNVLANRPTHSK
jgi:hypothetical protein